MWQKLLTVIYWGWFDIKKILIILYLLLISVGIYAIGVGVIRNKENEKKLIILERQYIQKKQTEDIKTSTNLYQNFYEAKIVWGKNNVKEASSVAQNAENKANQEEIDRIEAERKAKAKKASILANNTKAKVSFVKTEQKAKIEAAKIEKERLDKIETDRLAKIEADNAAKKAAELVKAEADKEALEKERLEKEALEKEASEKEILDENHI